MIASKLLTCWTNNQKFHSEHATLKNGLNAEIWVGYTYKAVSTSHFLKCYFWYTLALSGVFCNGDCWAPNSDVLGFFFFLVQTWKFGLLTCSQLMLLLLASGSHPSTPGGLGRNIKILRPACAPQLESVSKRERIYSITTKNK